MAAERYSTDILQTFYEPIQREENRNIPENREFRLYTNNFVDWLRAWRMGISERGPNNKDLLMFARENKEKFVDKVKEEIQKLKSVKISFGLSVKFSIERDGETQCMKHYFGNEKEKGTTHVFNKHNEDKIGEAFDNFIEDAKGEIEVWSERGSGWVIERIEKER